MLIIDHKYVGLLSNRLLRFTKVNPKTYNFRCPICGDSKRNSYKARGYIMEKKDVMLFYCHNCNASLSFANFLKQQDITLYTEYMQEKFLDKQSVKQEIVPDITKIVWPDYRFNSPLKHLKKISQLPHDHPAKLYVVQRKIPFDQHHKLFYAPRFKAWVNKCIPEKFNVSDGDEPRLIIPFIDKEKKCFGVQGRSFKKDGLRYITIMFDESKPKIFGYDTVDLSKRVYVLEGPIDSMFISNAIAMAGSDVNLDKLPDGWTQDLAFVYDNEPRNKQIVKKMEKAIDLGYNVVIWPDNIQQKDVNDMILSDLNPMQLIRDNTYYGLEAKMRISQWKKV